MAEYEGTLDAHGLRFGIVVSRFNEFITARLLEGAKDALTRHGADPSAIDVAWVPGALELAPAARLLSRRGYDAVICLGAVLRGATPHFEYVAQQSARSIHQLAMDLDVPVIYGVLTADTLEQAIERAGTKAGNRGFDAGVAAIEMARLYRSLDAALRESPASRG